MNTLPWSKVFGRRCPARTAQAERCDLAADHGPEIDHAAERGMYVLRWPEPTIRTEGT